MYDPLRAPYVSHFTGTDRVVEHVERYVSPTVTSDQVLGGKPFRYSADRRPRVAFLVSEDEYKTETTLPPFAAKWLGKDFAVSFVFDNGSDKNALSGLGPLDEADVLVVSARRRVLPADQLAAVRRHVAAGKAVVGIRTASHAFAAVKGAQVPAGHDVWPEFDPEVLGGHYTNHHKPGPAVVVAPAPGATSHPVLTGVDPSGLSGNGSLYKVSPLTASATPLLVGTIPGQPPEPVAWTNLTGLGGRVFYTSFGHEADFAEPGFQRLLLNAIAWAAGRDVTERIEASSLDPIPFPK
jgi:hypothetical protein